MKGLFVIQNYTLPDFVQLENDGLTDVFFADSALLSNYDVCKTHIQNVITAMEDTKLNLWLDENAFLAPDGTTEVDPHTMSQRNLFCNAIIKVFTDFPQLKGLTLEDYFWGSQWTTTTTEDENATLASYAQQMATALHSVNSNLKFAPTIGWQAPDIPGVTAVSDILMAQCYYDKNYYTTPPYTSLNYVLNEVGNIPVIPLLGTMYTPSNAVRPLSDILEDIANITRVQGASYILYAYPWVPTGLKFPPIRTFRNKTVPTRTIPTRSFGTRRFE